MPTIDLASGVRIRYQDIGPRGVRPLVLAHGYGVSLEMWWPQEAALSRDHRLITWDARSHGESSALDYLDSYTMPALAADLRGLLEGIEAVGGAVIGGMSFGGMIALQYGMDHPGDTHALILSDTTTRGDAPSRPDQRSDDPPGRAGTRLAVQTRPDLTAVLHGLDLPALVIVGEWDEGILGGLPRLVDELPRRRVVLLRQASHGTSGQRPDAWNEAVLRFLAEVEVGHPLSDGEVR